MFSKLKQKFDNFKMQVYAMAKSASWRWREKLSEQECDVSSVDITDAKEVLAVIKDVQDWVQENIEYSADELNWSMPDHWPTSNQVLSRMKEDCDGQAIMIWRLLKNEGFDANDIGMFVVDGHMSAFCYTPDRKDFWVIDNGYLSKEPILASDLFPLKKNDKELKPLYMFTLHRGWMVD